MRTTRISGNIPELITNLYFLEAKSNNLKLLLQHQQVDKRSENNSESPRHNFSSKTAKYKRGSSARSITTTPTTTTSSSVY